MKNLLTAFAVVVLVACLFGFTYQPRPTVWEYQQMCTLNKDFKHPGADVAETQQLNALGAQG